MQYDDAILDIENCRQPQQLLKEIQAQSEKTWVQSMQSWFVTDHKLVSQLYKSKNLTPGGGHLMIDAMPQEQAKQLQPLRELLLHMMLSLPDDRHKAVSVIFRDFFSPKQMKALSENINALSVDLMTQLKNRADIHGNLECDWYEDYACLLPATVITNMVGIPKEDEAYFVQLSQDILSIFSTASSFDAFLKGQTAFIEIRDYCKTLFEQRLSQPKDDLMSYLASAYQEGKITEDEIFANCPFILFAGHETTASLLCTGLELLASHPEAQQEIRQNPALIDNAIQEMLRFDGPSKWTTRIVAEDFSIAEHIFKQGELVYLSNSAANRDPAIYDDADMFNIHRNFKGRTHLGFGQGAHYCLGAYLALMEAKIAFNQLLSSCNQFTVHISDVIYEPLLPLGGVFKGMPAQLHFK